MYLGKLHVVFYFIYLVVLTLWHTSTNEEPPNYVVVFFALMVILMILDSLAQKIINAIYDATDPQSPR